MSYVLITLKDGSTMRVAATTVGPRKFWAFYLSRPSRTGDRWAAYDAAGKVVASGSLL